MFTLIFVLTWVFLGVGLLLIALSGGPSGALQRLQSQSRGSRKAAIGLFVVALLAPLVLAGEAAHARRRLSGAGEAVARHVLEHVIADAPVGHGPTPAGGPRLLVLVVVQIVPSGTGVMV